MVRFYRFNNINHSTQDRQESQRAKFYIKSKAKPAKHLNSWLFILTNEISWTTSLYLYFILNNKILLTYKIYIKALKQKNRHFDFRAVKKKKKTKMQIFNNNNFALI